MPDKDCATCFVDSNIWLYAFIEGDDEGKSVIASALLQERELDLFISTQVINEVCVNLLKRNIFTEDQLHRLIEAFYEKYAVTELSKAVLIMASQLRQQYSLSYWDSLIVACALSVEASILYSEDMQHGLVVHEHLQIVNPFIP